MAKYIKATKAVADYLNVTADRNRTADGNYLLWQSDVARFPGDTVEQRAAYAGGVAISNSEGRREIDGTDHPAEVHTPDWLETQAGDEENNQASQTGKEEEI